MSPVGSGISDVPGLNVSAATAALKSIHILISTKLLTHAFTMYTVRL
jgi:hypothetical protein